VAKRDRAIGRRVGRAAAVAALALSAGACTELDNTLAKVPFFAFMHESPAFDPYEMPRPAPPNAVPFASPLGVEDVPPIAGNTEADLQAFAAQVTNPLPMSDEVLAVGRQAYQTHCFVCHGATGAGDGPVIGPGRVPFALSVLTPRAREFSDGYLYGIIRVGRGLMPGYGGRIPHEERWAIVNYVRYLQQTDGGAASAPAGAADGAEAAASGRE